MTDPFETRLKELVQKFDYPATPPITERVMARIGVKRKSHPVFRKFAWAAMILLLGCLSLMAVPPVRAAVIEFIQIGVVRIFLSTSRQAAGTVTPQATSSSLFPLLESIAGETTLENARQQVNFSIPIPTYPNDLGMPDRVFVQNADFPMVFLLWVDPQNPERVIMSLHLIPSNSWAIKKGNPTVIEMASVHGQLAAWTSGPYPLIVQNEDIEYTRLMGGHALIWVEGNITYRLETELSLDEAIKIAESLQTP